MRKPWRASSNRWWEVSRRGGRLAAAGCLPRRELPFASGRRALSRRRFPALWIARKAGRDFEQGRPASNDLRLYRPSRLRRAALATSDERRTDAGADVAREGRRPAVALEPRELRLEGRR